MKTDPIEQLMSQARDIHLTDGERSAMRRTLLGTMALYPARAPFVRFFARHALSYAVMAGVLLTGATGALAHRAMPGDLLYPVKTNLNDRVAIAVAGNEDEKIQKELDLIGRSLDEEDAVADQELIIDDEQDQSNSLQFDDDAENDLVSIDAEMDAALKETPDLSE